MSLCVVKTSLCNYRYYNNLNNYMMLCYEIRYSELKNKKNRYMFFITFILYLRKYIFIFKCSMHALFVGINKLDLLLDMWATSLKTHGAGPSGFGGHTHPIDCIYLFILDFTSVAKNLIFTKMGFV